MTKSKIFNIFALLTVLAVGSFLRFYNLGYSEFIPDETTVMDPLKRDAMSLDYLVSQRKGPVQFLIPWFISLFTNDFHNEFIFRFIFSLASVASLIIFCLFLSKISNKFVAWVSTLFFSLLGFHVAFGRIVQYQSFNLFFSFLSLALIVHLNTENSIEKNVKLLKLSMLSLLFSFLSHWDAVFVVPIVFYYIYIFIRKLPTDYRTQLLNKVLMFSVLYLIFFVLFLSVYFRTFLISAGDQSYFLSRIGSPVFDINTFIERFKDFDFKIQLYNPYYFYYFLGFSFVIGLLNFKKSWIYYVWLFLIFTVFILFVKKPGTHLYNMLLPFYVFFALGLESLIHFGSRIFKLFRWVLYSVVLVVCIWMFSSFLFADYLLFIDKTNDYPWNREKLPILVFSNKKPYIRIEYQKTKQYSHENLSNNIIGFPIKRGWDEANEFVNSYNTNNNTNLSFITNDVKSISSYYMDTPYETGNEYFAIGVKRPFSFQNDYSFPQIKNKKTVYEVKLNSESTIRIYYVSEN